MNCITSATETSFRLPEMAMWPPPPGPSLSSCQLDQALQGPQLAILGGEQPRREQRRGGMGRQQVQQVAVLGAQDRLVIEQLEQHQRADHLVLYPQGHCRERPRV